MSSSFSNPTPQFGTAEYVGTPEQDHCRFCHQPIAGNYYRVNGAIACGACATTPRGEVPRDAHAVYMHALLYGIGAAVAGMIIYATFEIATGIIVGYISLAVGWMVGKAMMKGSNGVGGRRYQIAAVLLNLCCGLAGRGSCNDSLCPWPPATYPSSAAEVSGRTAPAGI